MPKLSEFYVDIAAKVDALGSINLAKFGETLASLPLAGTAAVGAIAAVGYEIAKWTDAGFSSALGFKNFASATGESAEALQRWQQVAKSLSLPVDQVGATIAGLIDQMQALKSGMLDGSGWTKFGLNPNDFKNANDLMDAIMERTKTMTTADARLKLPLIKIDPNLFLPMFHLTHAQFNEKARGGMDQAEIDRLARGAEALNRLNLDMVAFENNVAYHFAPAVETVIKVLDKYINTLPENVGVIKKYLTDTLISSEEGGVNKSNKSVAKSFSQWVTDNLGDHIFDGNYLSTASNGRHVEINHAPVFHIQGNDPEAIGRVVKDLQLDEYRKIQMEISHGGF